MNSITLVINGNVTLADYAKAMGEFHKLIEALNHDFAPQKTIEWQIEELETGSTRNTITGIAETKEDAVVVETITNAYEQLAESTYKGDISRYSPGVQEAVCGITEIINGRVPSVRFETENAEWEISQKSISREPSLIEPEVQSLQYLETFGAVKGRVQSMTRHNKYKFSIYDLSENRSVTCYLSPEFEEQMREIWGQIAIVEGSIKRDPNTGKVTSVRQVKSITKISEGTPGGWRKAMGCAPNYTGGVPSDEAIRRLRDE
ncbi:MAG: hypothetical protein ABIH23_31370 [bacterium]